MSQNSTIREILSEERPYEKCEKYGADSLTDVELLAILLRTGTKGHNVLELARKILYPVYWQDGILNIHHWTMEQLMQIKGIGKIKAIQILCLSELAKRLAKADAYRGLDFRNPSSIAEYYMEDMRHRSREYIKLLMLNTKSMLLGETTISKGTINSSLLSPRELFVEALQKNAVAIILLHNHPSGDPTPSEEDILVTRRVKAAGSLIGIDLLDHIIIGNHCYISFAEQKLI